MERLIDATRIEQYILNNCSDNEEINAIYAEIINAPTIALHYVEIKHGRWTSSQGLAETGEVQCSNCKTIYYAEDLYNVGETDKNGIGQALMPNYCPHCGAKMDEPVK